MTDRSVSGAGPVLIALGSNIDPEASFRRALRVLREHPGVSIVAGSTVYRSAPVGSPGAPDFLNAALQVETELPPAPLKREVLRTVEEELGRVRTSDRNAPRTLDLDLAIYGDRTISATAPSGFVVLPDPDIERFLHLARPLADLQPDFVHPELSGSLVEIADRLERSAPGILEPLGQLLDWAG